MIDATIKTYATRQAAAVLVALGLAGGLAAFGPSLARPGSAVAPSAPPATVSGYPLVVDGDTLHFTFSGNVDSLIKALSQVHVTALSLEEPTLEEIFMHYYEKEAQP